MKNCINQPNSYVEVFMSLIKWFFIILVINNLIWGGVIYFLVSNSSSETVLSQDGTDNVQGINNGTIN